MDVLLLYDTDGTAPMSGDEAKSSMLESSWRVDKVGRPSVLPAPLVMKRDH